MLASLTAFLCNWWVVALGTAALLDVLRRLLRRRHSFHDKHVLITGGSSGIGKALGMQDLVVGDPIYDDLFIIQGDDEMWARSVLHDLLIKEHIRAPMLQLYVKDGWVETIQAGYDYDVDRLERRMRMTAAFALSVEAQP